MSKTFKSLSIFWLSLSIIAALIFSFSALQVAFQSAYVIQDDARQHVFWMYRFVDPELFPNDLIADYFQSVAPLGYATLYRLFAYLGVEPLLFNKILPAILGVIATAYCFGVCLQMFSVPLAGFIASLLLNQNLWLVNDLSSGTPRAFFTPLFLAFLYYLLKRSLLPCLITIALQSLFYPHIALISAGVLFMQLLSRKKNYLFCCAGIVTAATALLFYAATDSPFGSVISVSEAKLLPEFLEGGRSAFFLNNSFAFWLYGERSGILPREWQYVLLFSFGCLLPLLRLYPLSFPLAQKLNGKAIVLLHVLIASLMLFFGAHLVLFQLHLPSRYTQHSLRILIALANGIFITIILDSASKWIAKYNKLSVQKNLVKGLLGILLINLFLLPSYYVAKAHPERLGYVVGESPLLYQFFQQQPKDILIASLTKEADFIPSFSRRSLLTAQEYSIPYHTGYYSQLRQRTIKTINAQYSGSLAEAKGMIKDYKIDFWLLAKDAFSPEYIKSNLWLMQFPQATGAIENLQQRQPALSKLTEQCTVFEDNNYQVLQAECILAQ